MVVVVPIYDCVVSFILGLESDPFGPFVIRFALLFWA